MTIPAAKGKNASYEARHKQAQDWPIVLASVNLMLDGDIVSSARIFIYGVAPIPCRSDRRREHDHGQARQPRDRGPGRRGRRRRGGPLSMNAYKVPLTTTVVKRALLAAVGNRYWEEA